MNIATHIHPNAEIKEWSRTFAPPYTFRIFAERCFKPLTSNIWALSQRARCIPGFRRNVCELPDLHKFSKVLKRVAEWSNIIFETCVEFVLAGIRAPRDKGDGRILLGDNTGARFGHAVADRVPVWWSSDVSWSHLYMHVWLTVCIATCELGKIRLEPDLPWRNYCVSWKSVAVQDWSVFLLLCRCLRRYNWRRPCLANRA